MYADNPLHRARIALGISLGEVTARTFLSPRIVQRIDDGAFDQLPGGVYARSYIRTFAALVGLEPEATVEELSMLLPPADDPIPVLRQNIDAVRACQYELWDNWIRLARGCYTALRGLSQRCHVPLRHALARGIDACLLSLVYAGLLLVTAWTLGLPIATAFTVAGLELAGPWSVVAVAYSLLFVIAGRTPGAALCKLPPTSPIRLAVPRRLFIRGPIALSRSGHWPRPYGQPVG